MKSYNKVHIAFFSVVLNHHQADLADEMWSRLRDSYVFIELRPSKGEEKGRDDDYTSRPYLLQSWKDASSYNSAMSIAKTADVCVFASNEALPFQIKRMKTGLISFEMSERWLKNGLLSVLSPRLIINQMNFHLRGWRKKPLYKLCCSAYASKDQYLMHSFIDKCFAWGYFTKNKYVNIEECLISKPNDYYSLMWCSRFVEFKHPEIPLKLACLMKRKGLKFRIDMYGDGPMYSALKDMAKNMDIDDVICFYGQVDNTTVQKEMQCHHAFLFTSDKREGWGVVANEAMNNGCLLIASNEIGSIPYLVKDMQTGIKYNNGNLHDLYEKLYKIMDNQTMAEQIIRNAYTYIRDVWSPENAADKFLALVHALQTGDELNIVDGPCALSIPV